MGPAASSRRLPRRVDPCILAGIPAFRNPGGRRPVGLGERIMREALGIAAELVLSLDPDLMEIVGLSMRVSLTATALALALGLPLGAFLAVTRFRGRGAALAVLNAMMGLPPVVVGLIVYLHLSRAGPLGFLGLLYTPAAMVAAQTLLIAPIVAALSRQILEDMHGEYADQFHSFCLGPGEQMAALVWDARHALLTVALAGFGRALAEVGAVMIVGGNIDHLTRVMTTAIALETSRGELGLALALGIVLVALALAVNLGAQGLRAAGMRHAPA
jgi:tungstate transport system permease protein